MTLRIYPDTCVFIAALAGEVQGDTSILNFFYSEDRKLLTSCFVYLEVLPKPIFNRKFEHVERVKALFSQCDEIIEIHDDVVCHAMHLSSKYDLSAMDALHVAAAIEGRADEFVTMEKPTKPLFRVEELRVVSLYRSN